MPEWRNFAKSGHAGYDMYISGGKFELIPIPLRFDVHGFKNND